MSVLCSYSHQERPCEITEWCVAYRCDRCDSDGTSELCESHYDRMYRHQGEENTLRLGCSECQGTLSFIAERLDHEAAQEIIN